VTDTASRFESFSRLRRVDDDEEVVVAGTGLTGPRGLGVAVVLGVEAPQGFPARQAKYRLSGSPEARHLDVADSSPDPEPRLQVMVGLAEVDLAVRSRDAEAAEVDELVALDRGPAALVLPAAHSHHDVHLLMVTNGGDVGKRAGAVTGPLRELVTADRGARRLPGGRSPSGH